MVSENPVDLGTAEFTPIRSFNDIMKTGVQIFQVSEQEGYTTDQFYRDVFETPKDDDAYYAAVEKCIRSGQLRWMNEERGINPV